jgi:hypothetical protein
VPSAYTPLLGLVLPVTGELDGTWGTTVNTQLTTNTEDAIAGYSTADVTSGNWTLTTTGGGASNEARTAILLVTGAPATTRNIYAPKSSKTYVVVNNCTDQSSVYLKGGPTSPTTGVEIEAGGSALCAWDNGEGDFVKVAGGGGGASGGGSDQIFFENDQTVTANYTIPTGKNAGTFGPVTIDSGVTVTVPDDSVWSIV